MGHDGISGASWSVRWLYDNIVIPGGSLIDVGSYEFSREGNISLQYTKRIMPDGGYVILKSLRGTPC